MAKALLLGGSNCFGDDLTALINYQYLNKLGENMIKFKNILSPVLLGMGLVVCNVAEAVKIGDTYQGGIVFFVDVGGQTGLIAAKADQNNGNVIQWFNGTDFVTDATAVGLYAGEKNTGVIVATQNSVGLVCGESNVPSYCQNPSTPTGNYAALVAANYSIQSDGVTQCKDTEPNKCYGNWYLPSIYELKLMYKNIGRGAVGKNYNKGGFAINGYWGSQESSPQTAWFLDFDDISRGGGSQSSFLKSATFLVRAIRPF